MNDRTKRFLEVFQLKGLTGYQAGKLVIGSITKQKISNLKNGLSQVTLEMISDLCNYDLDINAEYIITGRGYRFKSEKRDEIGAVNNNYHGNFTHPIQTVVGSGNVTTIDNENKKGKTKKEDINSAYKNELIKLKAEIDSLKSQVKLQDKLLAEKERIIEIVLNKR